MYEVYRAMKTLDFVSNLAQNEHFRNRLLNSSFVCFSQEWKMVNPFHVRVRSKNLVNGRYAKNSLQLCQVDCRSYLLDLKSLSTDENEHVSSGKCLVKRVLTF